MTIISTKAQIWGTDLMIAAMIFILAISFFYLYTINAVPETEENLRDLSYEGGIITDIILSEGYPEDWNLANVDEPGILTGDKVNETKLELLYNLTFTNYSQAKTLFNTANNFYFFFDGNMTVNKKEVDGLGKPGFNRTNIIDAADNLMRINRVVVYQNKLSGAVLYIWN